MPHSKLSMRLLSCAAISAAAALGLSACIQLPHIAKTGRMYEGDEKPVSEVVTLVGGSWKSNRANLLEKLWFAEIIAVDGKPWPGRIDKLQVLPGDHKLTMTCYIPKLNGGKGAKGQADYTFTFKPGERWYPWATDHVGLVDRSTGAAWGTCGNTLHAKDGDWDTIR